MSNEQYFLIFGAGALGSLVRTVLDSGRVNFPKRVSGGLALGVVGTMLIGGFVGLVVDGQWLTAAMGGFVGHAVLDSLIPQLRLNTGVDGTCDETIIKEEKEHDVSV